MKRIALIVATLVVGFGFSSTASAQDSLRVRIGNGDFGFSLNIGDRHRHRRPPVYCPPPRRDCPPVYTPPVYCPPQPPVYCPPPAPVCHDPIQVVIRETVGYRTERVFVGYTEERVFTGYSRVCDRQWDRRSRCYVSVWRDVPQYRCVQVPQYECREVPIIVERTVTATWCPQRQCYGYTDRHNVWQRAR